MTIAIIGVTGLVGQKMLQVIEEQALNFDKLLLCASKKSSGKEVEVLGKRYILMSIEDALVQKPDIAIFSAGAEVSLKYAPLFAEAGTVVVDNSSAWRMHPDYKLIVPEINAHLLTKQDRIIANPNCSTIQLVMVLAPLNLRYKIRRVVVSTYQSVTGTGIKAVEQLKNEQAGIDGEMIYPYQIHENCLPHCDTFNEDGYTKEELKLMNETKKILDYKDLQITATAVRVPVVGGHSESVNIEFHNEFDLEEVKQILEKTEGVILADNPQKNIYPMPKTAADKDEVFVGRIRRDFSAPNSLNLWITADNLRKGAATNAVQIVSFLMNNLG